MLKEIAYRLRGEDLVDISSTLPAEMSLADLTPDILEDCKDLVFVSDEDGNIVGKIKKELLEYLYMQHRKSIFMQILGDVQEGIVAVDATGRIFYLNKAYSEILNVKPYKIIGKYIQNVEPKSLLTKTLSTRQAVESANQKIASVNKHVSLRIVPLYSGKVFAGAVSIFQDVTELHDLNQEVTKISGIADEYSRRLSNMSVIQNMGILTQNREYLNILDQAEVVSRTDVAVLIRGENGVGKEMLAKYIHQCSMRKDEAFITVNCAAIPGELLESELFGYEEGAFTGALRGGKKGKFEVADKGTIFLDEIGDMPLPMQSKLLRVIQYGELEKLGRQKNIHVDVRIIAATNQPLEQLIKENKYRQDLFFRLNTFTLRIPPLRERPEDIVLLTNHFLKEFNRKYEKSVHFSNKAYTWLQEQAWPGNTRELQGCIERAVIMENEIFLFGGKQQKQGEGPSGHGQIPDGTLQELLWAYEGEILCKTLDDTEGNRSRAMERLGLSRRTFYRKCAEHGITGSR